MVIARRERGASGLTSVLASTSASDSACDGSPSSAGESSPASPPELLPASSIKTLPGEPVRAAIPITQKRPQGLQLVTQMQTTDDDRAGRTARHDGQKPEEPGPMSDIRPLFVTLVT
jgi:hypothetical protein